MKYFLIIILIFSIMGIHAQNGVAISTSNSATPDASAILDVQSTTQGMLVPRMNKADRDAITAATGLLIYQTDNTPGFYYYDGSNWKAIGTGNSNVDEIKDLSDGKTTFSGSLFLGSYAGPGGDVTANIGVGTHALEVVSGGGNVALGYYSLNDVTNGHDNTGIGYNVGEKITTGKRNTLIGADVAKNITTGERNIVIGYSINTSAAAANNELNIGNSLYAKNIYSADAYFGINTASPNASAALDITSTSKGLLIPRLDIDDLSTATPVSSPATSLIAYNTNTTTGVGFYYWDGSAWTAIGGGSSVNEIKDLTDGETGNHSLLLGKRPLGNGTINNDNTGIGYAALDFLSSGNNNIAIGYSSGGFLDAGSNNVLIGTSTAPSASSANNELNIANSIYGTNIYPSSADAHIGINTNSPNTSAALDISSSSLGLLIPRLDIDDLSTAAPVSSPATSLIAYNINTTTGVGFYYWDGSAWTAIGGSSSVSKIDDLSDAISNTSDNNVFLGDNSGTSVTVGTGKQNVSVGIKSLKDVTDGINNTVLGYEAGSNITTGNNNIIIGSGVNASSSTANNEINMGSVVYATNLYGTAAKVGVGFQHNAPKSTLDVKGSVSKTIVFKTADYTATAYDYTIIYKHTSGSPALTLPDATAAAGRIYVLRTTNVSSGQEVTITAAGSDKIYRHGNTGYATMELGYVNSTMKYYSETLQSDGAGGWWIIDAWEEH